MGDIKKYRALFILTVCLCFFYVSNAKGQDGCTAKGCHMGISNIVPERLEMMQLIKRNGQRHGDPDGCVICHGGNPKSRKKKKAHRSIPSSLLRAAGPKEFYPNPGGLNIAKNTCGVCHPGYVYRTTRSLMNTAAGQIQGSLHAWGVEEVRGGRVPWGNYDIKDTDGPTPMGAFKAYEAYMFAMISKYPKQYPEALSQLPSPNIKQIGKDPKLAGFTLQRQVCQRCHIGIKGRNETGDHRGSGCAACHMPYGTDGIYKGEDKSVPKNSSGHILVHQLRGNRKTGGILVNTCNTCHNGGKSTGTSFIGQMESAFQGELNKNGKSYLKLPGDLHHNTSGSRFKNPEGGLLCQDCHTSIDIHGDGNIHGTTLAQVEIECTDCHGTPDQLPWELPLGYKDEFGRKLPESPRGVTAQKLLSQRQFGFDFEPKDGFLLTARGNPIGNVVRSQDTVIVHSAQGFEFKVPLLKQINSQGLWQNPTGKTAMTSVTSHLKKLECYSCHSTWTPQAYGTRVKVDYSPKIDPEIETHPIYLRWEDPVLGINGEGKISPLTPGCQVKYTIIGKDRAILAENVLPRIPPSIKNRESAPYIFAFDTAPAQPHTNQRKARTCENCHTSQKAAGLGSPYFTQEFDWSKIVTQQGEQIATVGSHWPLSRAFNKTQLDGFLRIGTCMGCHSGMDQKSFWKKVSTTGILDTVTHEKLMNQAVRQLKPKN